MTAQNPARTYFVDQQSVAPYHPANHAGTTNHRLIGPETVGATKVELVLGVIEKGKGALPHSHPGIEQVCYLLEGSALAEVGGQARVLVIYTPSYGEVPANTIRG